MFTSFFNNRHNRTGHSLIELIAAMIASAMLLAGLGSTMWIARNVAYTPMGASWRVDAANLISQLSDELRHATLLTSSSTTTDVLEFVVADRNADGKAEKIRYEWTGTTGAESCRIKKTLNGVTHPIAQDVYDCRFDLEPLALADPPIASRTFFTHALVRLQAGDVGHARIDAAIPLISRPERLAPSPSYWRIDFDANPANVDADRDSNDDWVAESGASFGAGQLNNGTWIANGTLKTNPTSSNSTAVAIVEARCKNLDGSGAAAQDVLRFDQQTEAVIVRMQKQLDSSQTITLVKKPTAGGETTLKTVNNLVDDYVRIRLIIIPGAPGQVSLQINDVGDDVLGGSISYSTPAGNRFVRIGGNARFDYVDVRLTN
jgi:hypothetical protein